MRTKEICEEEREKRIHQKRERGNTEEMCRQLGIGKVKEHWECKIFKWVDEKNLRY